MVLTNYVCRLTNSIPRSFGKEKRVVTTISHNIGILLESFAGVIIRVNPECLSGT
jgi:hypothetical protein